MPSSRAGYNQLGIRFICYSVYAWSVPLVIVSVGQILDYYVDDLPRYIVTPQFNGIKCWFNGIEGSFTLTFQVDTFHIIRGGSVLDLFVWTDGILDLV